MTIDASRRAGPAARMRVLTVGSRAIRVAVRDGAPGWPPLLLCNGIGASPPPPSSPGAGFSSPQRSASQPA